MESVLGGGNTGDIRVTLASMLQYDSVTAVSNIFTFDFENQAQKNFASMISGATTQTINFANVPTRASSIVEITYTGTCIVLWPVNSNWLSGDFPALIANKIYRLFFKTINGGITWQVEDWGSWDISLYPSTVTPVSLTNNCTRAFAQEADSAGYRYGYDSNRISRRKIDNSGFDTYLFTLPDGGGFLNASFVYRFPSNGRLVCIGNNASGGGGKFFQSDLAVDTSKAFTAKLDMTGYPLGYWDWDVQGDEIWVTEYNGLSGHVNNGQKAYYSPDQGTTWTTIFDRLSVGTQGVGTDTMHMHHIHYDPYAEMTWIACGDYSWSQVFYSFDDMGEDMTWYELYDVVEGVYRPQMLGIFSNENYVIFGTDSKPDGIRVIKKPTTIDRTGRSFTADMLEQRYVDLDVASNANSLWHSFRKIGNYIYAVSTNTTQPINPKIIASPDGYNWYEVYKHERLNTRTNGGFLTFYSDGTDLTNMYSWMYDDSNLQHELLRIPLPTWSS